MRVVLRRVEGCLLVVRVDTSADVSRFALGVLLQPVVQLSLHYDLVTAATHILIILNAIR